MKNIKHMMDVVDKIRDHVALGLMSDPGLSKTSQIKQWAEEHGRAYYELILSQRMPSEISGMPMPVSDTKKMEIFDFDMLLKLKDGDVLAFDEFTNGNIQTLNACLTLIQERTMISGKKLPSVVIVAMGNPQGRCDLLPQTKQRFLWVDVRWDENKWIEYMEREWKCKPTKTVLEYISEQYRTGFKDAGSFNYWTPRTIENLFRIAQNIPRNDEMWAAMDIPLKLLRGIYESLYVQQDLSVIKQGCIDWTLNRIAQAKVESDWIKEKAGAILSAALVGCETQEHLRELVTNIEVSLAGIQPQYPYHFVDTGTPEWNDIVCAFNESVNNSTDKDEDSTHNNTWEKIIGPDFIEYMKSVSSDMKVEEANEANENI